MAPLSVLDPSSHIPFAHLGEQATLFLFSSMVVITQYPLAASEQKYTRSAGLITIASTSS